MIAAPLSLYLQLEEGKTADMEVVARAALAFSAAVKEAAFKLDPAAQVRVELVSGTEGSLSLNSIIRFARDRTAERPVAAAVIVGVLSWFGTYTADELMDELRDARVEISEEQISQIARRAAEEVTRGVIPPQAADVYRELSQDAAVKGVGATPDPDRKPHKVVPRSEFPARMAEPRFALAPPDEELPRRRTRRRRQTLIIISPVLLHGDRRWKLASYEGEFGAAMRDRRFLDDVLTGRRTLPTVEGVQMDAIIETTDVWTGLAWQPTEHVVLEVFDVTPPPVQTELALSPAEKGKKRRRKDRDTDDQG